MLDALSALPYTLLFVSGNHENFDLLEQYPVSEWHGGNVQFVSDSVIHLMRGQVYELDGRKLFTFGGGSSHDIEDGILEPDDPDFKIKQKRLNEWFALYRVNHISWWRQELPSQAELAEGLRNLAAHRWKIDHIVIHCAPTSLLQGLDMWFEPVILTDYLEEIKNKCSFKKWFFGHYHMDRELMDRFTALYHEFRVLDFL